MTPKELGDQPAMPQSMACDLTKRTGLTKRELFAAKAMQGIFSSDVGNSYKSEQVTKWAVEAADLLLAELAKTKE